MALRSARAAPALLFDFAAFGRHLFVEFSLTSVDLSAVPPEPVETDFLDAGALNFF